LRGSPRLSSPIVIRSDSFNDSTLHP
jgi:hypothetical protein